jgi:hypothetical protein
MICSPLAPAIPYNALSLLGIQVVLTMHAPVELPPPSLLVCGGHRRRVVRTEDSNIRVAHSAHDAERGLVDESNVVLG